MNWKHTFQTVLVLAAAVVIIASISPHNVIPVPVPSAETGARIIRLAGQDVRVSVVSTPEARTKGLSGRTGLARGEGMLFIFNLDAKYGFWMKDMLFPIDILWLSSEGRVVDMRESVSPATYPAVFTPNLGARYVLELFAGFASAHNVKIGDFVDL
ncbi:MAG: DUF192 domain-containing protein [bacterium]|nr:DUF192 domain-containing protein [bacterium]